MTTIQKKVHWCGSKINEKTGSPKWMIMGVDNTWYSSFNPDVGKAVEQIKAGDTIEMEIKSVALRGGAVINELISVKPIESAPPQSKTAPVPSGPSCAPTPDREWMFKQALIISQNALTNAVATYNLFPLDNGITPDLLAEKIQLLARAYADHVWSSSREIIDSLSGGSENFS